MATISPAGPSSPTSAGALLAAIRDGTAVTRADLARHFGLARSTVAQRVDALLAAGLVYEAGGSTSTGGRPPTVLAFNQSAGIVLVADLGATHARIAVSDLAGTPLAETTADQDIALGPEEVLGWTSERFAELLQQSGHTAARGARHRHRRAGPGRVLHRPAGQPADHARLGRLLDPRLVRRSLRRTAGARRQRREHHGPRRALDPLARHRAPAARQGRHGHRLRHRRRRTDPPRRARRGRRHRPHPRHRRGRRLHMRQRRLPGGRGRRPGAGQAVGRRGRRRRQQPRRRAAGARRRRRPRCAWCATPAARSARCSPGR